MCRDPILDSRRNIETLGLNSMHRKGLAPKALDGCHEHSRIDRLRKMELETGSQYAVAILFSRVRGERSRRQPRNFVHL